MNLKLKAAGITVGVIGSGLISGYVLSQLPNWVALVVVLGFAAYMVFSLALSGLKFDQSIEEMNKK
jgi:CBS-domain-containing membrane protein